MKELPVPKLCCDCAWSKPESPGSWNNRCYHPIVVMADSWALSNNHEGQPAGVYCRNEREKRFFRKCGQKGKLYKLRPPAIKEASNITEQSQGKTAKAAELALPDAASPC